MKSINCLSRDIALAVSLLYFTPFFPVLSPFQLLNGSKSRPFFGETLTWMLDGRAEGREAWRRYLCRVRQSGGFLRAADS
jgi:hypothetical protein